MTDRYARHDPILDGPADDAFAVTPGTTALTTPSRALWIGNTGDVQVTMLLSGTDVTFKNVLGGTILALRVSHVLASETTASDIVAMV